MSINFPTSLDSLPNPTSTDLLENATLALDHDQQHSNANDAIEALEAKVGVDGSAVTTSHDYKLSGVTGSDKAVSKTGTETLTNKTLTAPVINAGSDATGDIYYRSAGGVFTRLPIGSNLQILQSNGTIPAWVANPSAANASTTVAGIVEAATSSEVTAGTATGGTGAVLAVTPDALASSAPTFSGANLTNLPSTMVAKTGSTSRDMSTTTTTTIAHGLGKSPKYIRIMINFEATSAASGVATVSSHGTYNGTTQNCIYTGFDTNGSTYLSSADTTHIAVYQKGASSGNVDKNVGTASFDATNISITWAKTNSPVGTGNIIWEAVA